MDLINSKDFLTDLGLVRSIVNRSDDFFKSTALILEFKNTWGCSDETFELGWKKIVNRSRRASRVRKRAYKMNFRLNQGVFLTLTFTDECISNTSAQTRHDYVKKFLTSLNCSYVANIDFGDEHGREHYHAIISRVLTPEELAKWHKHGGIYAERIHKASSAKGLSKYITKFGAHAVKQSTGTAFRVRYSRKYK